MSARTPKARLGLIRYPVRMRGRLPIWASAEECVARLQDREHEVHCEPKQVVVRVLHVCEATSVARGEGIPCVDCNLSVACDEALAPYVACVCRVMLMLGGSTLEGVWMVV